MQCRGKFGPKQTETTLTVRNLASDPNETSEAANSRQHRHATQEKHGTRPSLKEFKEKCKKGTEHDETGNADPAYLPEKAQGWRTVAYPKRRRKHGHEIKA